MRRSRGVVLPEMFTQMKLGRSFWPVSRIPVNISLNRLIPRLVVR